jgi:hypothetical protein
MRGAVVTKEFPRSTRVRVVSGGNTGLASRLRQNCPGCKDANAPIFTTSGIWRSLDLPD